MERTAMSDLIRPGLISDLLADQRAIHLLASEILPILRWFYPIFCQSH